MRSKYIKLITLGGCAALFCSTLIPGIARAQTSQTPNTEVYQTQGDTARCTTTVAPSALSAAACPGNTTTGKLDIKAGAFADAPTYSKCVQIDNATNKQYFIPLKTHREWIAFYNSATAPGSALGLTVRDCTGGATGTCGSANGTTIATAPTLNLCDAGTASSVTDAGATFTWGCDTASCSAYKTAACGAAASILARQDSLPASLGAGYCRVGTAGNAGGVPNNWTWTCTNGSSVANCPNVSGGPESGGRCIILSGTRLSRIAWQAHDQIVGFSSRPCGGPFYKRSWPATGYQCSTSTLVTNDCAGGG